MLPKIYFIEPEQKLEHSQGKHTHTHIYTHSSRSAHYWTSKVKTVLHLSKREQELLFQAGSGSWFSVVALFFSCYESTTLYRSGVEAEMETEEALHHPSRAGEPALIRLVHSLHCSLWPFALGISKVKWLPCFCFGESIQFVDFGSASSGGCVSGLVSPPSLCTLLLEPSPLKWTCFLCVVVTSKTVNVTNALVDQLVKPCK